MSTSSASWVARVRSSWALIAQHIFRTIGIFAASTLLTHLPVIVFCFLVLGFQAIVLLYVDKPWRHTTKRNSDVLLSRQQWVRVGINGAFIALVFAIAAKGLQGCGAIRFLVLEHSHFIVAGIVALAFKSYKEKRDNNQQRLPPFDIAKLSAKLGPEILLGISYFLLLWPNSEDDESTGEATTMNPELEELGIVWNILLLLGASLLKAVQQRFAAKLSKEVGGHKRLHSLSVTASTVFVAPLVVLDIIGEAVVGADYDYSVLSLVTFGMIALVAISVELIPLMEQEHYVKATSELVQCAISLPAAVLILVLFRYNQSTWYVHDLEPPLWIAMFSVYFTIAGFYRKVNWKATLSYLDDRQARFDGLPMYSRNTNSVVMNNNNNSICCSTSSFLRGTQRLLQHIWSDRDSLKIFVFLSLNLAFMFVEVGVGLWTNSLGLISDAGHMFFDCGALFIGLYASYMGKWKPDATFTYGYGRYEVLSGFVNGVFLIFIALFILTESIERITSPPELSTQGLLITSVAGFLVNMVGLIFFHDHAHAHDGSASSCDGGHGHSHHGHSHGGENENLHGVFLHILADTLGSLGVIISSLLIEYKGWYIADPVCSSLISILILMSVVPLLVNTSYTLLERPSDSLSRNFKSVLLDVRALQGVVEISDPHCWRHSKELVVASLHVTVQEEAFVEPVLHHAQQLLESIGVVDATVQVCDIRTSAALQQLRDPQVPLLSLENMLQNEGVAHGHSHSAGTGHHGHSHSSSNHVDCSGGDHHGHSHSSPSHLDYSSGDHHGHSHSSPSHLDYSSGDHHGHSHSSIMNHEGHSHSHDQPSGGHQVHGHVAADPGHSEPSQLAAAEHHGHSHSGPSHVDHSSGDHHGHSHLAAAEQHGHSHSGPSHFDHSSGDHHGHSHSTNLEHHSHSTTNNNATSEEKANHHAMQGTPQQPLRSVAPPPNFYQPASQGMVLLQRGSASKEDNLVTPIDSTDQPDHTHSH